MPKKILPWLLGLLAVVGISWWGVRSLTNLPGEAIDDMGRDHLPREELVKVTYNSNPPTSGPHDPEWVRPGVYDTPQDKYQLIHSLEHGYVVVHYNCALPISNFELLISKASAHEDEGDLDNDEATSSAEISPNIVLSEQWQSEKCQSLKKTLSDFKNKLGLQRVIINPHPELDKPVVLVAWGRILKLGTWSEADATKFAKAYHNKGPEQTME